MVAWLDIIGSIVIAGTLMISMLNINSNLMDRCHGANASLVAERDGAGLLEVLGTEFRRIGLRSTAPSAILVAGADTLRFVGNVEADTSSSSAPDTVMYCLGPLDATTPNPNDHALYRVRGAGAPDTMKVATGVTSLDFQYFDVSGTLLDAATAAGSPSLVKGIELTVRLENTTPIMEWNPDSLAIVPTYPGQDWLIRVRPKNL